MAPITPCAGHFGMLAEAPTDPLSCRYSHRVRAAMARTKARFLVRLFLQQ